MNRKQWSFDGTNRQLVFSFGLFGFKLEIWGRKTPTKRSK